jgi:hypothetical protein
MTEAERKFVESEVRRMVEAAREDLEVALHLTVSGRPVAVGNVERALRFLREASIYENLQNWLGIQNDLPQDDY